MCAGSSRTVAGRSVLVRNNRIDLHHGSDKLRWFRFRMNSAFPTRLGLIALFAAGAFATAGQKPNLIAIVTDDQAAWTIGAYGGTEIPTPHLDRISREGARFDNAFVHTPVCSPSRGTYLTGRFPSQLGFSDWLTEEQAKTAGITPATPSWPAILARNGYATGLIGKWHLGHRNESLPWHNGLLEFTGFLNGGWQPDKVNFITATGEKLSPPGFSVEICTDLAIRFIDAHKDRPFALLVHYREPHAPYTPMPPQDVETSAKAQLRIPDHPGLKQPYTTRQRRGYYASIAALDRNIGRILDHLTRTGLAADTVLTFTSDHGYNVGEHGIQHKGNGYWITEDKFQQSRPNLFDSSLRVPLMIRGPVVTKPGTVVKEWITNADMFASVLGMLGIETTAAAPPNSRDFSPALRGAGLPPERFPKELFGQYDLVNNPIQARMRMIRNDRWKLILHLDDAGRNELYDLAADPGERRNLFGNPGNEATITSLSARIRHHMEAIRDPRTSELP